MPLRWMKRSALAPRKPCRMELVAHDHFGWSSVYSAMWVSTQRPSETPELSSAKVAGGPGSASASSDGARRMELVGECDVGWSWLCTATWQEMRQDREGKCPPAQNPRKTERNTSRNIALPAFPKASDSVQ